VRGGEPSSSQLAADKINVLKINEESKLFDTEAGHVSNQNKISEMDT
jgi:hypothetical protein